MKLYDDNEDQSAVSKENRSASAHTDCSSDSSLNSFFISTSTRSVVVTMSVSVSSTTGLGYNGHSPSNSFLVSTGLAGVLNPNAASATSGAPSPFKKQFAVSSLKSLNRRQNYVLVLEFEKNMVSFHKVRRGKEVKRSFPFHACVKLEREAKNACQLTTTFGHEPRYKKSLFFANPEERELFCNLVHAMIVSGSRAVKLFKSLQTQAAAQSDQQQLGGGLESADGLVPTMDFCDFLISFSSAQTQLSHSAALGPEKALTFAEEAAFSAAGGLAGGRARANASDPQAAILAFLQENSASGAGGEGGMNGINGLATSNLVSLLNGRMLDGEKPVNSSDITYRVECSCGGIGQTVMFKHSSTSSSAAASLAGVSASLIAASSAHSGGGAGGAAGAGGVETSSREGTGITAASRGLFLLTNYRILYINYNENNSFGAHEAATNYEAYAHHQTVAGKGKGRNADGHLSFSDSSDGLASSSSANGHSSSPSSHHHTPSSSCTCDADIPLGLINKVSRSSSKTSEGCEIKLNLKDGRRIEFGFDCTQKWVEGLVANIQKMAFPGNQTKLFAFSYKYSPSQASGVREGPLKSLNPLGPAGAEGLNGWDLYDALQDYTRITLATDPLFRVVGTNVDYKLCASYPAWIVEPSCMKDDEIKQIASYRSSSRLPAVVWVHPITRASLSRCAQPLVGIKGKRSELDEKLVYSLRTQNPSNSNVLHIFDARPWKAAIGNAAMGKGFENVAHYEKATLQFMNIDNIHAIRNSLGALQDVCNHSDTAAPVATSSFYSSNPTKPTGNAASNFLTSSSSATVAFDESFLSKLESTLWLHYVRLVLSAAQRIAVAMSEEGASCITHCFPAEDHQLLTSEGYMSLDEVLAAAPHLDPSSASTKPQGKQELRFAAYNPQTQCIEYLPATGLIVKQANELIEFGSPAEWNGKSKRTNDVSLVVTPEHNMYAQLGKSASNIHATTSKWEWEASAPRKRQAHTLVTADPSAGVKMFATAVNGLEVNDSSMPFALALDLHGEEQITAFLHIYGYWLRQGTMLLGAMVFTSSNPSDTVWLLEQLHTVGLQHGADWMERDQGATTTQFHVLKPSWVAFFDSEYARVPQSSSHPNSEMCVGSWVFQLGKSSLRDLLAGLRRVDGAVVDGEHILFTSSEQLRDELMRVCMHAGYSAVFQLQSAGNLRGYDSAGVAIIAKEESWRVSYREESEYAEPVLQSSTHITRTPLAVSQRVWCVTVPPHGLIIARRVQRDDAGVIAKTSRPLVVGNCSDGWDRTSQLAALTELMLDPFYRTLEGFAICIEKEWLSYGHRFAERYGHGSSEHDDDQRAPIFVQWLDCVYQLLHQFPASFEFTDEYLLAIHDHVFSHRFGTFLYNNQSDRIKFDIRNKTVSLWTFLLHPAIRPKFYNPQYVHPEHVKRWSLDEVQAARSNSEQAIAKARAANAAVAMGPPVAAGASQPLGLRSGQSQANGAGTIAPLTSSPTASIIASFFCIPSVSAKRMVLWEKMHLRHDAEYIRTQAHAQAQIAIRLNQAAGAKLQEPAPAPSHSLHSSSSSASASSSSTITASASVESAWMSRYNSLVSRLLDAGMNVEELEAGIFSAAGSPSTGGGAKVEETRKTEAAALAEAARAAASERKEEKSNVPPPPISPKPLNVLKPSERKEPVSILKHSSSSSSSAAASTSTAPDAPPPSLTVSAASPSAPKRPSLSTAQLVTLKASIGSEQLTQGRKSLRVAMPNRPPPSTPLVSPKINGSAASSSTSGLENPKSPSPLPAAAAVPTVTTHDGTTTFSSTALPAAVPTGARLSFRDQSDSSEGED